MENFLRVNSLVEDQSTAMSRSITMENFRTRENYKVVSTMARVFGIIPGVHTKETLKTAA